MNVEWPYEDNGNPKKFRSLTPVERRQVFGSAIARLKLKMEQKASKVMKSGINE